MRILAFDTTNITLSVAILDNEKILAQRNIMEPNQHSTMLVPLIEECLNEAKIWYENLDLVAFTNGPGSFTGIRVGLSCAKAIAIATDLPVVGVSSLEAIAYSYKNENKKILVANDASLGELFIQEFDEKLKPVSEASLIKFDELTNFVPKDGFVLAGSAKNLIKDDLAGAIISDQKDFIDAKNVGLLGKEIFEKNGKTNPDALYIRKPKITERKN